MEESMPVKIVASFFAAEKPSRIDPTRFVLKMKLIIAAERKSASP